MKAISLQQTGDRDQNQLQQNIVQSLRLVLQNPLANGGVILQKVSLIAGTTVVNHGLNRALQGWFVIRKRAGSNIYDLQDQNLTPNLTLVLSSDVAVSVDLFVF